jgi:hypothetical protein
VDQFADTSVLPQSDKIGDWDLEINRATIGHFNGKKQYAIEIDPSEKCLCVNRNGDCKKHKVVNKGARLTFQEMERMAEGGSILYEPAAPSFSLARGIVFVDRLIRKTG